MKFDVTPEERYLIARAYRIRSMVTSEGYADLKKLLQEIEDETLSKLYAYDGTDDHETAVRAYQWKTVKAHKERLLGTITQYIQQGTDIAVSKVPKEALGEKEEPAEFTGVRPQCDVDAEGIEAEPGETEAEAPPKPPIPFPAGK